VQTYRELFAVREFSVLFATRCLAMLAGAASGLALGTITYTATGSPILTALSMFGGPLISLVASQLLLAGSDRYRPRTGMLAMAGAITVADGLQAIPGLPWGGRFVLLALPYVVGSMFSGVVWVVVRDIVPNESFILARSTLNLAIGAMQVVGYGLGGVALLWLSPTDLFLVAAGVGLVSLVAIRLGISDRPPRAGATGTLTGRTREVNRALLGSRITRPLYIAMWVPNGMVVGCEALFVPYGHGTLAGVLFGSAAAGMMLGDLVVGRFIPVGRRDGLIGPLRLLLATPYVLLLLTPPHAVAVALAFVASAGYAASLPLQERLFSHVAEDIQGQTMGLYGQGLAIWQALSALLAGAIASFVSPAHAMGAMACCSVAVTLLNTPGLRRSAPGAGPVELVSASASPSA
jgi:MFS family permease